jgi:hypothetical protein
MCHSPGTALRPAAHKAGVGAKKPLAANVSSLNQFWKQAIGRVNEEKNMFTVVPLSSGVHASLVLRTPRFEASPFP